MNVRTALIIAAAVSLALIAGSATYLIVVHRHDGEADFD